MVKRTGVRSTLRSMVYERDKGECVKCGYLSDELEVHHILPVVYGGNDDMNNLALLCSECHRNAPDTPEEFREYIKNKLSPLFQTAMPWGIFICDYISKLDDKGISELKTIGSSKFYMERIHPQLFDIQRMAFEYYRASKEAEKKVTPCPATKPT